MKRADYKNPYRLSDEDLDRLIAELDHPPVMSGTAIQAGLFLLGLMVFVVIMVWAFVVRLVL